jgi:hypothetical protein
MEIEKATNVKKNKDIEIPKKASKKSFFFKILFLLLLGGLIYSQYEIYKLKDPSYQQKVSLAQAQFIIDKVSKLMIVPNENPQIVLVQDVEKLRSIQPFFKDAENGDNVLIYSDIAIIYSPTKNKIVNVGPVTRDSTTQPQSNTTVDAPTSSTSTKTTVKPTVKTPAKTTTEVNQ